MPNTLLSHHQQTPERVVNGRSKSHSTLALLGLLAALAGCQSQPGLPVVDDSVRRPINSAAAIELQSCRAEASALRATLVETAAPQCPPAERAARVAVQSSAAPAPAPALVSTQASSSPATPALSSASAHVSRVAIFLFEQNQVSLAPDEATRAALKSAAQSAALIHVRGRSGASQDSPADTQAARRRAEAALAMLKDLGVAPQKLRVSWQGMADAGSEPGQGRRVEIEFMDKAPVVLFSRAAGDKPVGGPVGGPVDGPVDKPLDKPLEKPAVSLSGNAAGSSGQVGANASASPTRHTSPASPVRPVSNASRTDPAAPGSAPGTAASAAKSPPTKS